MNSTEHLSPSSPRSQVWPIRAGDLAEVENGGTARKGEEAPEHDENGVVDDENEGGDPVQLEALNREEDVGKDHGENDDANVHINARAVHGNPAVRQPENKPGEPEAHQVVKHVASQRVGNGHILESGRKWE